MTERTISKANAVTLTFKIGYGYVRANEITTH